MEESPALYLHIPFCRKKCDYCDFFSLPRAAACGESKSPVPDAYLDALAAEIAAYAENYAVRSWKTVYIGGGTPSLLTPRQLARLMDSVRQAAPLAENAEVTAELNPESVTDACIDSAAESGINRLSLGIQALDDRPLQAVHRGCSAEKARAALSLLSRHWKDTPGKRLSADLIAGLPDQTAASFKAGAEELCSSYSLDHLSLYTLTIEEGTPLERRIARGQVRWNSEKADRMWLSGRSILEKHGFLQYEVSNFARPGFESRHNSVYWHLENYIGCGAGASGSWYGKAKSDGSPGCEAGLRWTNTRDIPAYIDFWTQNAKNRPADIRSDSIPRETEILSSETQQFEYLMLGLRLREGIEGEDFHSRFNRKVTDVLGADKDEGVFRRWQKQKLARTSRRGGKSSYALTGRGILLLDRFLEELL